MELNYLQLSNVREEHLFHLPKSWKVLLWNHQTSESTRKNKTNTPFIYSGCSSSILSALLTNHYHKKELKVLRTLLSLNSSPIKCKEFVSSF